KMATQDLYESQSRTWIDEWQLGSILVNAYVEMGRQEAEAWQMVNAVRLMTTYQNWYARSEGQSNRQILETWLADGDVQHYLNVNRYKDVLWFNQEAFESFLWYMVVVTLLANHGDPTRTATDQLEEVLGAYQTALELLQAEQASEYQVERLITAAGD
ncbi:MAG: hypothetical protein GYA17_08485, partial [Chloroflexi bacterium]|nr:hypothetical protein [Chloroflexota bacterium]